METSLSANIGILQLWLKANANLMLANVKTWLQSNHIFLESTQLGIFNAIFQVFTQFLSLFLELDKKCGQKVVVPLTDQQEVNQKHSVHSLF